VPIDFHLCVRKDVITLDEDQRKSPRQANIPSTYVARLFTVDVGKRQIERPRAAAGEAEA
jgi:hypothetical protein